MFTCLHASGVAESSSHVEEASWKPAWPQRVKLMLFREKAPTLKHTFEQDQTKRPYFARKMDALVLHVTCIRTCAHRHSKLAALSWSGWHGSSEFLGKLNLETPQLLAAGSIAPSTPAAWACLNQHLSDCVGDEVDRFFFFFEMIGQEASDL